MALTFAASSARVLPANSAAVAKLRDVSAALATPLLLLDADVVQVARRSGRLLGCFLVAAAATVASGIAGWRVARAGLVGAFGAHDARAIAASLLAKNIGGGINFIAVANALGVEPQVQAAALGVDNLMALVYFPLCSLAAGNGARDDGDGGGVGWDRRRRRRSGGDAERAPDDSMGVEVALPGRIVSAGALLAAALFALVLVRVATALAPTAPLLAATALAIGAATCAPRLTRRVAPAGKVLGESLLYCFFAGAGAAGGSLGSCLEASGRPLLIFLLTLYAGHAAGLALAARFPPLLRKADLALASNACIGGPATAAALASSKGWTNAVSPSMCVGTFGYAIASFIALATFALGFKV